MKPGEQRDQIRELFLLQRIAQRINAKLTLDSIPEEILADVAQTFGRPRSAALPKDCPAAKLVKMIHGLLDSKSRSITFAHRGHPVTDDMAAVMIRVDGCP